MICYLSHAIGSSNGHDAVQRHDNIANALAWLEYLTNATNFVVTMPWFANVVALSHMLRDRALQDQTAVLRRCDAIIFVGESVIGHQLVERRDARTAKLADIDLTDQAFSPPPVESPEDRALRRLITNRATDALARVRVAR